MTVTAENFFSWPVAAWLTAGAVIVATAWLATSRMQVTWQRVFVRAAVFTLCFTPLPALELFTEAALAGHLAIIPLWYALFWAITHGAVVATAAALMAWLILAYFLWVGGMSVSHLLGRHRA